MTIHKYIYNRIRVVLDKNAGARRASLMISPFLLALSCPAGLVASDELDRSSLIKLIDGAQQAACRDVSFEYEGKEIVPGPIERDSLKIGPDGIQYVYTGTLRWRSDGAATVDMYTLNKRVDQVLYGQIAILKGITQTSTVAPNTHKANIRIKNQDLIAYAGHGNYRAIWLADYVRMFANSSYLYSFLGYKQVDGKECLVVRFRLVMDDQIPKDKQVSYTFWIDMARGGNVVRVEHRWGNDLVDLTTIRLDRFAIEKGHSVWLPVSGRMESRLANRDGVRKFLDEPVYYLTYDMIPVTIRFNQGLKDSDFTVHASRGDAISDEVRKAKFEYGQYMVRSKTDSKLPTDTEVKAELDRMLRDKTVMANELKASSPLRDGPGLLGNWPWAVAGLAVAVACFLYYKGRNP